MLGGEDVLALGDTGYCEPEITRLKGTQFANLLRTAKRAGVQATTKVYRPRFSSSRDTTITG